MWKKGFSFSVDLGLEMRQYKPLRLIWVRPGTFLMGTPLDDPRYSAYDDEPEIEVTISKGFWLSQFLVTNIQWFQVMGSLAYPLTNDNANCPVSNVNWYEAMDFCEKLNRMFKEDLPDEYRFRLPTEAQWEYACRAGTQSVYYSGNTLNDLDRVAWHKENSGGHPHPVGEKEPNDWGFYDMLGNVVQWCQDDMQHYPKQPVHDWIGIGHSRVKVVRGGCWATPSNSSMFQCTSRTDLSPDSRSPYVGFRISLRILENIESIHLKDD